MVQQRYYQDIGNKVILQYLATEHFRHVPIPYWAYIEWQILLCLIRNNSSAVYISATYANNLTNAGFLCTCTCRKKATAKYTQNYIERNDDSVPI
jgi:hypothetical protein